MSHEFRSICQVAVTTAAMEEVAPVVGIEANHPQPSLSPWPNVDVVFISPTQIAKLVLASLT